ncbi:MAG: PH domain-containing protein [Deltaproteobacteria bacterium]|jgi:hypothetical protein|nr:PH domain-containing protein [Deltaproteobacteria bacterium]
MGLYSDDLPDYIQDNSYFGHLKTFGIRRELRFFSNILTDNEKVLALTRGWVDGRWWLMGVTDIRVILVRRGVIYGLKYLEIPIVKIKSVSYKTGLFFGSIFIDTGSGTAVLESVNKKGAAEVSTLLCEVLGDSVHSFPSGDKSSLVLSQLERLASLRDKGALTEEEFLAQKENILSANDDPSLARSRPGPRNAPKTGPRTGLGRPDRDDGPAAKVPAKVETLPDGPSPPRRVPEVKGEPSPPSPGQAITMPASHVGKASQAQSGGRRPYSNKRPN